MRTQAHRIVDTDPKRGNVVVRLTDPLWGRRLTLSESGHHEDPTAVAR